MRTPSPPGGSSGMLSPGQTKPLGVSSTPGSFQVNTYFGIFSDFQATLTLCRQKSGVFGVFWPFWVFLGFFCHFLATFGQGYQILDFAKSGVLGVFLKFFFGEILQLFGTFCNFFLQLLGRAARFQIVGVHLWELLCPLVTHQVCYPQGKLHQKAFR